MAHFAKISEENEVLQVVVVDDKNTTNGKGVEEELVGQTFLEKIITGQLIYGFKHLIIQLLENILQGLVVSGIQIMIFLLALNHFRLGL